ncbi:MAG: homoserine kinase [Thermosynechococcaceae cyanobacterium]
MATLSSVLVQVPATTANVGPGFDCLGAALTLYNQFQFTVLEQPAGQTPTLIIEVEGIEANRVQRDAQNLVYKAFCTCFAQLDRPIPSLQIDIRLGVPLARGLGSSATAIIGGLMGANALAGSPLSQRQVLDLAIALEGHPDNVAPALLGGCQLAAFNEMSQDWTLCPIQWADAIVPIVAIPDFELSTQTARNVLPNQCSYADAIFNIAHLGLLVKGLEAAQGEWIQVALQDRLHQPYRIGLIPGFAELQAVALHVGAYGLVISGAGPTVLALCGSEAADTVSRQMQVTWKQVGISAQTVKLQIDTKGATVQLMK